MSGLENGQAQVPRPTAPEPRIQAEKCPECGNPNPQGGTLCSDCVRRETYDMSGTLRSISGFKVGDEPYYRANEALGEEVRRMVASGRMQQGDADTVLSGLYKAFHVENKRAYQHAAEMVKKAKRLQDAGESTVMERVEKAIRSKSPLEDVMDLLRLKDPSVGLALEASYGDFAIFCYTHLDEWLKEDESNSVYIQGLLELVARNQQVKVTDAQAPGPTLLDPTPTGYECFVCGLRLRDAEGVQVAAGTDDGRCLACYTRAHPQEGSTTALEIDLGAEGSTLSTILTALQALPDHSKTRVLNAVLNLIPMMEFEGEATFVKPDAASRMAFLREPNNDTSTRAAAFEHLHALMQDDGDGSEGP